MTFYILCKNEAANIRKCLTHLIASNMHVVVLDSGSTDETLEIVREFPVELRSYRYTNHCNAYNEITNYAKEGYCGILDADMELTSDLAQEILQIRGSYDVLISPIKMYVDGLALEQGNLCPPKPIVFKYGKSYFESVGHGERLVHGLNIGYTQAVLPHNDLKPYISFLGSQLRYAENFIARSKNKQLTWRDKLRLKTPLLILIVPLYSLFIKGGIFNKQGWLYAIDRLIAEAIMYRWSVIDKINKTKNKSNI